MKLSILTHPLGLNYGGILQAYALSHYLQKKGHTVTVLNRQPNKSLLIRMIKAILVSIGHPRYNDSKYRSLKKFVKKYIPYTKPLYSSRQMINYITTHNCEAVIVGSDQVWRADFAMRFSFNYFLDFVPNNMKRLSYAASFGLSEWGYTDEQTQKIKKLVRRFTAISIREDEGLYLCDKYLGVKANQVIDPTLLLCEDDYSCITSPRIIKDNYIFVYWLGDNLTKQKIIMKANITDKRVIDVSLRDNKKLISIENWLSYIKYADKIITDSFHGCVFSIIFKKQFLIGANSSGGNGRIRSLLAMLGMNANNPIIDYNNITPKLENLRRESYSFLKQALQQ